MKIIKITIMAVLPFLKINNKNTTKEEKKEYNKKSVRKTEVGSGEAGRRRKYFFWGVDFERSQGRRGWVLVFEITTKLWRDGLVVP